MTLLVDIGNSRVKFARLEGQRLQAQRALEYRDWRVEDWQRELFGAGIGIGTGEAVLAATVAGTRSAALLREAAAAAGCGSVEFVSSTAHAAGVRNGYAQPAQLGVDRWLALLAARQGWVGPVCVVDVGTAATVDALAGDGVHLGGFIVPGPELMARALLQGTSDLAARATAVAGVLAQGFPDNTRDAIGQGCLLAVAALAERTTAELERITGANASLLLTGGAGSALLPRLGRAAEQVPDLVLRGLAVLAAERATR